MTSSRKKNLYTDGLDKCAANYAALTPLGFLERAGLVYPNHVAVIDGEVKKTWGEIYQRCRRLASALAQNGIGKNDGVPDTVSVIAPNSLAAYEGHFAVPMAGAVLNTINTRLDADTVAFILDHGEAKVLLVDAEFAELARAALKKTAAKPLVIDIEAGGGDGGATRGRTRSARPPTKILWRAAMRNTNGNRRRMNGTPFPSATPPAPPATPRAWSTIIAAPISTP